MSKILVIGDSCKDVYIYGSCVSCLVAVMAADRFKIVGSAPAGCNRSFFLPQIPVFTSFFLGLCVFSSSAAILAPFYLFLSNCSAQRLCIGDLGIIYQFFSRQKRFFTFIY